MTRCPRRPETGLQGISRRAVLAAALSVVTGIARCRRCRRTPDEMPPAPQCDVGTMATFQDGRRNRDLLQGLGSQSRLHRLIVFHHGWPLSADDWDNQMMFFLSHGYRVIAHDRRGHGRSRSDRRR